MEDIKLIKQHYWNKFKSLFPEVSEKQFEDWVAEDYYIGGEDLEHTGAAGRRELKTLYASIRAMKPKSILEIGTYKGDSGNHVLLACEHNKKEGFPCEVTLLDINNYLESELHNYPYNRVLENSVAYLPKVTPDFIVQDGNHSYQHVLSELKHMKNNDNLKCVWAHDYHLPGRGVKPAWDEYASNVFNSWHEFNEPFYAAGFAMGRIK